MDIEQLATAEVSRLISYSEILTAQISTNDKTIFTDGHIEVFSEGEKSKRTYVGRVPVQVKGRSGKPSLTFSVPALDLEGFAAQRGVLYLVVFVDRRTKECTPYYSVLSPFRIKALLRGFEPGQSPKIQLQAFPSEPDKIEAIVRYCVQTQKEDPDLNLNLSLINDLNGVTVYAPDEIDFSAPVTLVRSETNFSVVFNSTDGQRLPVDGDFQITPSDYLDQPVEYDVSAGGVVFESVFVRRINPTTLRLKIGDGISIEFSESDKLRSGSVTVELQGSLAARRRDLAFVVAVVETGGFYVDGNFTRLASRIDGDSGQLRSHLAMLDELTEVFEMLHVDTNLIDLLEITENQYRQLQGLGLALRSNEDLDDLPGSMIGPSRVRQQVGRWWIDLLRFDVRENGNISYADTFDRKFRYRFVAQSPNDENGFDTHLATPYDFINVEQFGTTLNLNLPALVDAYDSLSEYSNTASYANLCVLKLLEASDAIRERRDEFLSAAAALNMWLISREGEQPQHLVNYWQISARCEGVQESDRKRIRELKHAELREFGLVFRDQIRVSCAILLGERQEVEYLVDRLSPESRRTLLEWPIWHLFLASSSDQA